MTKLCLSQLVWHLDYRAASTMEMAEGNRHNCNASKYTESKNIGKMFKENKNSLEFHAGLFLVLYFKGKPDFIMIS